MFSRTVLVLQVASERRWTPFAWYLRHGEDLRVATAQLVWTIIPRGGRQRQPDDAATESQPRFSLATGHGTRGVIALTSHAPSRQHGALANLLTPQPHICLCIS